MSIAAAIALTLAATVAALAITALCVWLILNWPVRRTTDKAVATTDTPRGDQGGTSPERPWRPGDPLPPCADCGAPANEVGPYAWEYDHPPTCPQYLHDDDIPWQEIRSDFGELVADAVEHGRVDIDTGAEIIARERGNRDG